jgi:aryl-alcohol dehydrogenase-like predicted oxidoreductase
MLAKSAREKPERFLMKMRKLGNSGLEVSPLALGGNVFGWTVDESKSFRILDTLVSLGFNFIDTADVYSKWVPGNYGGESETIIGKWIKQSGNRDKVVIATKVGMEMDSGQSGLSRSHIIQAVEDSLHRLQTDHIDLYQSHIDDADTPLEETLGTYQDLMRQGKIRAIGASNYGANRLEEALRVSKEHGLPSYQTLQPLYNLCDRADYERELEPVCAANGLGVITYFSLASGFLSGKYRSEDDLWKSRRGKMVKEYLNPRGFRILEALDQLAARYESSPAKIALAWLMTRPSVTAPIASATSLEQLHDLVDATELELDHTAIEVLNQASAPLSGPPGAMPPRVPRSTRPAPPKIKARHPNGSSTVGNGR